MVHIQGGDAAVSMGLVGLLVGIVVSVAQGQSVQLGFAIYRDFAAGACRQAIIVVIAIGIHPTFAHGFFELFGQ